MTLMQCHQYWLRGYFYFKWGTAGVLLKIGRVTIKRILPEKSPLYMPTTSKIIFSKLQIHPSHNSSSFRREVVSRDNRKKNPDLMKPSLIYEPHWIWRREKEEDRGTIGFLHFKGLSKGGLGRANIDTNLISQKKYNK